jgi:FkbM family methyltransferase
MTKNSFGVNFAHSQANFLFNKFRFPGSRKIARKISKLAIPTLTSNVEITTIYGYNIEVSPKWGEDVYNLGFYEAGTLKFIDLILKNSNNTFLDIGANIGLMSLHAAQSLNGKGKVVAFEPVQFFFDKLNANINLNQFQNIQTIKKGVGSVSTKIPIYLDGGCPSVISTFRDEKGATEMIDIESLDEIVKNEHIVNIDFIKIDVEGFEFDVLKGARKTIADHKPVLCIEYIKKISDDSFNAKVITEYLKELNAEYRFFQFIDTSRVEGKLKEVAFENDFNDEDNLFCVSNKHMNLIQSIL